MWIGFMSAADKPIFSYKIQWNSVSSNTLEGLVSFEYANDEVHMDEVFSLQSGEAVGKEDRRDFLNRQLKFSLELPDQWNGSWDTVLSGEWEAGDSMKSHPDVVILGLEDDWTEILRDYIDDEIMATEVNFELMREVYQDGAVTAIDFVLDAYYRSKP